MSSAELPGDSSVSLAPLLEESADDLYENAPCGYLSTLVDGTVVRVNGTFLAWTGHDRDDLVDRVRFQELLAAGDRIFYETHYAPLLQLQGTVREIAAELVRADGSRMPVLLNSVLRRDPHGEPAVIRTTVFDAGDRRQYEQELLRARREAETRARAATALAHVDDGVLVVDVEGRIAVANASAARILQLEGEAEGRPVAEVVEGWETLVARIPLGTPGLPAKAATLPFHGGGHEHWLSIVGVDAGDGVVYTIRDVTADRRLETMRDELIGIVSHELRTPLTGVYGAAQTLLARDEMTPEQRRPLLSMIVEQAERLTGIIDEILLTRRLDADDVPVAQTHFDLGQVAAATALEVGRSLGCEHRIRVTPGPLLAVSGDPGWTRQALANLVENALKYSPADTPVLVEVSATPSRGRVAVADEGPGIAPAERERIFERFSRLDPDLSSGVGGAGLGLYVARELVRRMDGRVGLDPTDAGSTFFIELPLAPPD